MGSERSGVPRHRSAVVTASRLHNSLRLLHSTGEPAGTRKKPSSQEKPGMTPTESEGDVLRVGQRRNVRIGVKGKCARTSMS